MMDLSAGITYEPHARAQMRARGITEAQVRAALAAYHTSYPAEPLPHSALRSTVYIGVADGRDLKVYVRTGSHPPHVTTAVWKGDDQ